MYAFLAAIAAAVQPVAPSVAEPQPLPAPPPGASSAPAAAEAPCCTLPKLTPVYLTITQPIESDKATIGQSFTFKLANAVKVGDALVIPAGTPGMGEVVHAAKSRAMGKAGELVLAARYLDWNGTRVPLRSFKFGKPVGLDNSDTAAAVSIAVSIAAPFITGGEVRIASGADAWAKVAADVTFQAPQPAPSAAVPETPATTANSSIQKGE